MPPIKNYNFRKYERNEELEFSAQWREGRSLIGHSAIVNIKNKTLNLICVNSTGYHNATRPFDAWGINTIEEAIQYAERHCKNPEWYISNAGRARKN